MNANKVPRLRLERVFRDRARGSVEKVDDRGQFASGQPGHKVNMMRLRRDLVSAVPQKELAIEIF
jgi:hypothetical protein